MVWLVPFLSPDSDNSQLAARKGWLVKGPDHQPVVREWWNGSSAVLDLTNHDAVAWLRQALHRPVLRTVSDDAVLSRSLACP